MVYYVRMKTFVPTAVIALLLAGGCVTTSEHQAARLEFDVVPCANEIHISLDSIVLVTAQGARIEAPEFKEVPLVTYTADGKTEKLGDFCPGCSDSLRIHEPPPLTEARDIDITISGQLTTGEFASGTQRICLDEF